MSLSPTSTTAVKLSSYYAGVQNILSLLDTISLCQFKQLTTDEARFDFIWSLDYVQSAFPISLPASSEKSATEAKRLRQRGNELYKEGSLREALVCYNNGVIYAPVKIGHSEQEEEVEDDEGCAELTLAYGNRSATLLQMKMYEECLEDIERAIDCGYPTHLEYKLIDRQGRCLVELRRWKEAETAFNRLLQVVERSRLEATQKQAIVASARKKIESCSAMQKQNDNEVKATTGSKSSTAQAEVPGIKGKPSDRYPGASEAFDVRYNPESGRYGVAVADVAVGDIVLVEAPYVSVLCPEMYTVRCFHCFRSLVAPIPCHRCIKARFCSEACRSVAWETYHKVECPWIDALIASRTGTISLLVVRVAIATGLQRMLKYKRNPKSDMNEALQSLFINSDGVYLGGYMAVYSLLSHARSRKTPELLQYTVLAVWIMKILRQTELFARFQEALEDKKTYAVVGGIVLRFLQIISCNGIEVTEMIIGENLQKCHPATIGLALYPTVSLLNHSCDPVLELVFYGHSCAIRAIQNIGAGQDLTIDYGFLYYTTPREDRLQGLRAQYFFNCQCLSCLLDWGLRAQLRADIPALKCPQCGEASSGKVTEEPDSPSPSVCSGCRESYSPVEVLEALYQSQSKADEAIQEARKYRIQRAIPVLERHLTFMAKHLLQPWREYVTCLSMLKQCYRMLGNRRRK